MDTRRATQRDLPHIQSLLQAAGLPPLPSSTPLANIVVALEGHEVVGAIAMDVRARSGLVRSAVVAAEGRRQGVGASLVRSIVARAHELGLRDLYLLTENASDFFGAVGFEVIDRSEAPPEIRSSPQFKGECPESALLMRLALATRW